MGVALRELLSRKEIELNQLSGKVVVIDGNLFLYQFLTTIRGIDGTPLKDSNGDITSHLVGLFSRTVNLMQKMVKQAFVFDGKSPELKHRIIEQRASLKLESEKRFLEAKQREDMEDMKKYASRTSRLTDKMVEEAKKLISYLGLPIVQAPSEGEAQAAHMVRKGDGFAVGSQDFDSLVHGATKLVRNLSIAGRRKKGKLIGYETVKPELIDLAENLNSLGIDKNQLIALAMIIGTDYNPGGIKGVGPKNALKLVKKHKTGFDSLFKEVKWDGCFDFSWEEVFYLIKRMPLNKNYKLEWKKINSKGIYELLVEKHDFSGKRVNSVLENLNKGSKNQTLLNNF